MRPILVSFGPFNLFSFGLMLVLGIVAAALGLRSRARAIGVGFDRLLEFLPWVLLSSLVGARLTYMAVSGGGFAGLFALGHGGLSFFGGIAFGSMTALLWAHRRRIPKLDLLDTLAPGMAVGEAVTRLGCDIFGKPTASFLGVLHNGVVVHPVQLYSFALNMGIFLFLQSYRPRYAGQTGAAYLVLLGVTRFVLEFFRQGSTVLGFLTWGHMAAAAAVLVGIVLHKVCRRNPARVTGRGISVGDLAPLALVPMYFIF